MPKLGGKRTINAAASNYHAVIALLNLAETKEEGSFIWSMAAIVFAAFTYEAYLNMIGKEILGKKKWEDLDRCSWKKKHSSISRKLSLDIIFSVRPENTLIEIFGFRNSIAHRRNEEVEIKDAPVDDFRPSTLTIATETEWERRCTANYARMALEDVLRCVRRIDEASGRQFNTITPFGATSSGRYAGSAD